MEEANEHMSDIKDDYTGKVCPKLFTVHCQGSGGFEAYFLGQHLYYRTLPANYHEPTHGSNGVLIGKFQSSNWYFLGLEHEKGKVGRSQLNVVINTDKKKNFSIEFPKVPNAASISKFVIGENLFGRMSSVVFFKNLVSSSK